MAFLTNDLLLYHDRYHWLVNYAITGGGFKDEAMACMDTLLNKYGHTAEGAER